VFVIAHRRLIDARRASDRRPKRSEKDDLDNQATEGGNVEDDAVRNLEAEWVTGILEYLTDEQREVLSLRVVADLSLAETARVMDKTTGAVKALQRRALIAARNHIERGGVTQ
jgi:RNA polymerase sigma-70 factor (ECF subfamily)